jgi:hypothetical protein
MVANYNCWYIDDNSERADKCARLSYEPFPNFKTNASIVFDKFDGHEIFFHGDSTSLQSFINLTCRLQSYLINHSILRSSKSVCNDENLCLRNDAWNGYQRASGLFSNDTAVVRITFEAISAPKYVPFHLKPNDLYIFNHGLHMGYYQDSYTMLKNLVFDDVTLLKNSGVNVLWRETIAPQFLVSTQDGLWSQTLREDQKNHLAQCVDRDKLNVELAWNQSTNFFTTPLMEEANISILRIWNVTLSAPAFCHIGGGRDCVHYCEPGVFNYITDALLYHIRSLN